MESQFQIVSNNCFKRCILYIDIYIYINEKYAFLFSNTKTFLIFLSIVHTNSRLLTKIQVDYSFLLKIKTSWVVLGSFWYYSGCFRPGFCSWTCFGASRPYGQNLQSRSSAGVSGQPNMSKIICYYCKKSGHIIAYSCKRQNANSHRQLATTHLAAPPEMPTESETYQSPYSIGPLQHYFYDHSHTQHT